MRYRQSMRERLGFWAERMWQCTIRRRHREKMGSYGRCIRCGKRITS